MTEKIDWIYDAKHHTWHDSEKRFFIGYLALDTVEEYVVSRKVRNGEYSTIGRTENLKLAMRLAFDHLRDTEKWPPRKKRNKEGASA